MVNCNPLSELKGKRLLVLGGSLWRNAIKIFCDENNITIIAVGNDPSSGICDIADEYYNVNSIDKEKMKKFIVDHRIDGVYMGGNETVISAACEYINELDLPCYCIKGQWEALQNKQNFKELCRKFELPTVKKIELNNVDIDSFPVITKPSDGCASNGFSVCHNKEELIKGVKIASEASPTGSVIIEQFVPNDGIVVFYTVSEGKIIFSAIEDKYPVFFNQYGTYVGGLFDFESQLADEFRNLFEKKIQKLITHLKILEGNFWIEVFYDGKNYYFNEVGFRYGGSGSLYPVDYCHGINQVAVDIYYALTGKSKIYGFSSLYGNDIPKGKKYAIYPIFLKTGIINKISGITELLKNSNILNILSMKKEGNSIPDNGSFGQVALLIHFIYTDVDGLRELINEIHKILSIKNEKEQEMIVQLLDINNIRFRQKGK